LLGPEDGLDGVRDDLAGHQRVVHAAVPHRDAVRDRDGAELEREAVGAADADLGLLRQPGQGQVAGRDLVPGGRDADLRLAPVVVAHPDGAQHAARRGAFQAVGDDAAVGLAMLPRVLACHGVNLTGYRARVTSGSGAAARAFRLPRSAYLIVLFIAFGTVPVAFTAAALDHDSSGGVVGPPAAVGWQTALVLLPAVVAVFIARTATLVDDEGIRVRALLGSRRLAWNQIRGLSVSGRSVYAVTAEGSWRLPCVHVTQLGELSRASGGHLPELPDPRPKSLPARRRR
jgi:hypothetical protein